MSDPAALLLVVDDLDERAHAVRRMLGDEHRVVVVRSPGTALDLATTGQRPALLLVGGPDLAAGMSWCRQLTGDTRLAGTPAVLLVSPTELVRSGPALAAGAVDVLAPPLPAELVRARVAAHLRLHDREHQLHHLVEARTRELRATRDALVQRLGRAASYREDVTGANVLRIAHYTRVIALESGLSVDTADLLQLAAPLHDVGKIGIPDAILKKPGELTEEEFAVMQTHTTLGAALIGESANALLHAAWEMALTHHERWDGSGYPVGLVGEQIPLAGRISALADVFDALTSPRAYKEAWSVERAASMIMTAAGRHFDPGLTDAFERALPRMVQAQRQESAMDELRSLAGDLA